MSRQRGKRPDKVPAAARARETEGWCPDCGKSGKWLYADRRAARSAAHRAHPGKHLTAYPCPHREGLWHYCNPRERDLRGYDEGVLSEDAQLRHDIAAYQHAVAAAAVARIAAATNRLECPA